MSCPDWVWNCTAGKKEAEFGHCPPRMKWSHMLSSAEEQIYKIELDKKSNNAHGQIID